MEEKRRTNLTESEIINETQRKVLPTARLPRGLPGEYRDVLGDDQSPGEGGSPDEGEGDLPPPTNIAVEDMEIGFTPDGTQYIDVTIGFDEVDGATNYDVKVTRT